MGVSGRIAWRAKVCSAMIFDWQAEFDTHNLLKQQTNEETDNASKHRV